MQIIQAKQRVQAALSKYPSPDSQRAEETAFNLLKDLEKALLDMKKNVKNARGAAVEMGEEFYRMFPYQRGHSNFSSSPLELSVYKTFEDLKYSTGELSKSVDRNIEVVNFLKEKFS